jgi:DnaJ-class molecular chaperone
MSTFAAVLEISTPWHYKTLNNTQLINKRRKTLSMKRINEYKKLFNFEPGTNLKGLKTTYRNLVKEWHPDKFQEGDTMSNEAEIKSRQIIEAYHFLVSIAPETNEANREEYNTTITETGISDFKHKGLLLEITFLDGSTYEYFGVPKNVYTKFANSDKQLRFARRNIFNSYTYRKSKKATLAA